MLGPYKSPSLRIHARCESDTPQIAHTDPSALHMPAALLSSDGCTGQHRSQAAHGVFPRRVAHSITVKEGGVYDVCTQCTPGALAHGAVHLSSAGWQR